MLNLLHRMAGDPFGNDFVTHVNVLVFNKSEYV